MSVLRAVAAEIFGLFVDDSSLALLVAALVAALGVAAYAVPASTPFLGVILLVGCLGILAYTTLRANGR